MVTTRSGNSAASSEGSSKFDDDFSPMAGPSKPAGSAKPKKSKSPNAIPQVKEEDSEDGKLPPVQTGEELKAMSSNPGQPTTYARDGVPIGDGPTKDARPPRPEIPTPAAYLRKPRGRSNLAWIRSTFTKLALLYLAACYFVVCPSDPSRSPDTCKFLADTHNTIATHSRPYLNAAQTRAAPYLKHAEPYWNSVKPYYDQTKPYYAKTSKAVAPHFRNVQKAYFTHAHPRVLTALTGAHKASQPYYESARKATDPYLTAAQPHFDKYNAMVDAFHKETVAPNLKLATEAAQNGYKIAHTHFHAHVVPAYQRAGPAADKWWRETAQPGAQAAYAWSHRTYVGEVHPRIVRIAEYVWDFLRARVLPAVKRWHSLYVKPQLDKITERVFEYRTHKVGREAKTEAKVHGSEKLHEAGFSENLDKFNSELERENEAAKTAKESPEESAPPGKSKEQVAAKRKAIEAVRDSYEHDLATLIEKERALFLQRLNDLREGASKDVTNRFTAKVAELEREADTLIGRLEKFLERSTLDTSKSVDEKIAEGKALGEKAIAKLQTSVDDAKEEVDVFGRSHFQKEQEAMLSAHQPVEDLAQEAQSKLGIELTWLDGVTYADWQRYHKFASNAESFREELNALQQGTRRSAKVARGSFYESLHALKSDMDNIVKSFNKRLRTVAATGYQILKGRPTGVADAARKASGAVSDSAAGVADKIAAAAAGVAGGAAVEEVARSVADSYKSASSHVVKAAGGTPSPSNAAESVSSFVASVYDSLPSSPVDLSDASSVVSSMSERAASALGDVSQSVVVAAGGTPSPTDLAQSASSLAAKATEAAAAALGGEALAEVAKDAYADASQSVIRAVGGTPSPTDLSQTASSIFAKVTDSLREPAVPEGLKDTLSSVSEAAASKLGDASQTIIAAVGGTPSPTNVAQSVSSAYARAADAIPDIGLDGFNEPAGSIVDAARSVAGDISQTIIAAAGGTPSPTDLSQTVSSVLAKATDKVADSLGEGAAAASKVLGDASQAIVSAVGGTPSPTDLQQSASSLVARATDSLPEMPNVGEAASQASSAAASLYSDAADAAHSVTRSAKIAAGTTPPAANLGEAAENAQLTLSSAYSRASEAVADSIPDPASLRASAASAYSDFASSASSVLSGSSSEPVVDIPKQLSSAQDFASSLAGAVSQSVVSAAGGTPSPTDFSQTLASAAAKVTDGADNALHRAEEAAQEAARVLRRRLEL